MSKPTLLYVIYLKNRSDAIVEVIHPNNQATLVECLNKYMNGDGFTLIDFKIYRVGDEVK
jgi:hypothetical protein